MTDSLSLAQSRALWWQKQALAGSGKGTLASLIGNSGWLRTLGGVDIYLAARARRPGMKRAELDAVMTSGELRVVPAARGCIYVVPSMIVGDLMALNAADWRKSTEKDLAKVGSSMAVVESMAKGVLAALKEPMTTDALRKALPEGSIPSFGDAGKKVGLSSPLPLVLRLLEFDGRVERTLDNGRLDTERYLWRAAEWKVPPAAATPEGQLANVISAFLDFAGPVTIGNMAAWSGRAQRDLKPVIDKIGAVPVTIDGVGEAWVRSGDIGAAMRALEPRGLVLLAFEDNYLVNHGGLALVSEPKHHAIEIDIWGGGGKPEALGEATHVQSRTIVLDGLVLGLWEVDPRTKGAVWHTFDPAAKPLADKLDQITADAAQFLFDELGHARTFTLDTMELVQDRADRIAGLKAGKPMKPKAVAVKVVKPPSVKAAATPAPKLVAKAAPQPVAKAPAAKRAAKKPAARKPAAKKPAAKKPTPKPAAKKPTPKPAAKKPAPKKKR